MDALIIHSKKLRHGELSKRRGGDCVMIKQIKHLVKLQLVNLYGINVFRFTKDKTEQKKKIALAAAYVLLIVMGIFYVSGLTYGYIILGLSDMVPAYLIMISSLLILFFSFFKAGSVIFQRNAYDILASLPISQTAIVVSRFIRMYVENLLLTLVVMLPTLVVFGILQQPSVSFYILGVAVTLFIPLFPITISTFLGALITAVSSRMKHKSIVSAVLSLLLAGGILFASSKLAVLEEQFTVEMLQNMSEVLLGFIGKLYPPAVWLGNAMLTGNVLVYLGCIIGGVLLFVAVMVLVSVRFHEICRLLYSTHAKQDYTLEHSKKNSIRKALYKREWKRYFSSSVYVTNTIIGPIMAVVFAITVLVMGVDGVQAELQLPFSIHEVIPFLLAGIFCMMPTTCSSISLEGKEWWIVKSLPIRSKDLFDSKILLNLSLIAPAYFVAELILIFALKPTLLELVWLLLIPVVMVCFSSVFGITINIKLPLLQWENEAAVVKQSASAFIGGLVGFLFVLLCMIPVLCIPIEYSMWVKLGICSIVVLITVVLYQKNNKVNLYDI